MVRRRDHAKLTGKPRQPHADAGQAGFMMTRLLLLVGLVCSGCVVLPATKTQVKKAGTERSAPTLGKVTGTTLQTGASRTDVRVRATHTRQCQRQVFAVTEVTNTKHAKLGVDDPRGRALGVILAPITIPISAIITGLAIAGSDPETKRVPKLLGTETLECTSEAGGLALELEFPSGRIQRGKTDENGILIVAIPSDEPYAGNVSVRGERTTAQIHYEQAVPPVTVARDAMESCRAKHTLERVTLRLTIDDRGLVTRVWLSAGDDRMHACVATKIAGLVFPAAVRNNTVVMQFETPS
jgi:hypothetical protein